MRSSKRLARRRFLAGAGTIMGSALAGCLGGSSGDTGGSNSGDGTVVPTATLAAHPAAGGLADQPTLGPDPSTAEAVIVAFEDPSCPRCAVFETQTVPQIVTELVEPGRAAFVFRGYPVVYPWGHPATQALESTYARDAEAHWALANHYFADQSTFDETNVLDRTRSFLTTETDLDAEAIVADADAKAHDAAVQADLEAGEAAGAGLTTPHVFLFRDGEYVTKAAGSVSFSVVKNALGY